MEGGPISATTLSPTKILTTEEEVALLESDISILPYLQAIADA